VNYASLCFCQTAFVVDEVSTIVKEAVEGAIGGNAYQHNRVNQWTNNVVEQCLTQLSKLGKPFKYIVMMLAHVIFFHLTLSVPLNSNLHYHAEEWSWFADSLFMFLGQHHRWYDAHRSCTVRWENKSMYCIVSVFGLSI
ncbi:hypothetical protein P4O66_015382, partial [Electrophorus voltai]